MKIKFLSLAALFGIIMLGAGFTPTQSDNHSTFIVLDGGDYDKLWQQAESLSKQGLPKSALEVVDNIYAQAKKDSNAPQFIKAVMYQMRLHSDIEENYFVKAVYKLNAEIEVSREPMKQILNSVIAEMYMFYYQANRYKLLNRSITVNYDPEDIETWDMEKVTQAIIRHYMSSLDNQDMLKDISLEDFDPILETEKESKQFRPTLYDFLAHRAVDYFMQDESSLTQPVYRFEMNKTSYLSPAPDFIKVKITTQDSLSLKYYALDIIQDLIKFHIQDKNPKALIDVDLKRLQFVRSNAVLEDKDSLYLESLLFLDEAYGDSKSSTEVSYQIARYYYERGQLYNPLESDRYKWDIKKANDIIDNAVKKYPKSFGAENCKELRKIIQKKSLSLTTIYASIPGKAFPGLLTFRNVQKAYFRIIPMDYQEDKQLKQSHRREDLLKQYLQKTASQQWEQELVDDGDFQEHAAEIRLPELPLGYYIILASSNEDFTLDEGVMSHAGLWATNLSYISQRLDDGSIDVYVLDRDNGSGIKDVQVQSYYQEYDYNTRSYQTIEGDKFISGEAGYFQIPTVTGQANRLMLEFSFREDKFVSPNYFYQQRIGKREIKKVTKTFFFTDRSIYRPGQTIYFKGIVLEKAGDEYSIIKDHETKVVFNDVNGQKISELSFLTNEFGSFNGSFVAPIGVLTGNMRIKNESGSTFISVEEYKRPKFEVVFEPVKGSYKLDEQVSVTGKAQAYSGNNVDQANVKYRVVRRALFPSWRYPWFDYFPVSAEMEISNGVTQTDENGEFVVTFTALPDKSLNRKFKPVFNYSISADVTDINGETHSGHQNVSVGFNALMIDINIPETLNIDEAAEFLVKSTNLNGIHEPAEIKIQVARLRTQERLLREREWTRPDVFIIPEQDFIKEFPNDAYANENDKSEWEKADVIYEKTLNTSRDSIIDMKSLAGLIQGDYIVSLSATDKFGQEVELEKYFTAFSTESKAVPVNEFNWFSILNEKAEPGEEVKFLVGTKEKNVHMIYEILKDKKILKRTHLTLSDEQKLIKIPIIEEHRGNVGISITFITKNRSYQNTAVIKVSYTNKELDISFASFRNKLLPGQQEEWQIKITDKNGDLVAAEMLASMYDASLDAFKGHWWDFNLNRYFSNFTAWNINEAFLTSSTQMFTFPAIHISGPVFHQYDRLDWLGMRMFRYPQPMMDNIKRMGTKESIKPQQGEPTFDGGGEMEAKDTGDKQLIPPPPKPEAPEDFSGIQVRRDFRETAFFFPDLRTDTEGNVIIKFTVPESLTRWRMMGLAYTSDLKLGKIEKELVTQKQLMVVPNPPRFFRQGDKMIFSAKIANLSDKTLLGNATLEFLDAITMQKVNIIDEGQVIEQSFEVSKGMSQVLEWAVSIPDNLDAITYRIVAKAGQYSDGEEMAIPVLTNRMLVTESLPLPINGKQTKNFKFSKLVSSNSSTARNFKLTLEFTSNPAWYAIQALPYLMETSYECSEQVFSRYYANSIASHIANSNPKIQRVFDSWKHLTPDALLSNLEKNQDLKAVILEETPWVMQAQSESERKQRVGLLFDLNHMANNLTGALAKLQRKQLPNGGWPWFEGMKDSRYITQHIVTGFGHLDHLGVSSIRDDRTTWNMIRKAVSYLDERIREDYEKILEKYPEKMEEQHISQLQIQYLYARTYFLTDNPVSKRNEEAFNYFREQAKKYWLKQSKYLQGMIALALNRIGEKSIPSDIMASIKEHALFNEEMGMYWKSPEGHFWYQAPIESQALLIEAFDEVAHDMESVEKMKIWLLKQKQTHDWKTSRATTEACYALLLRGSDLLASDQLVDITIGKQKIDPKALEDVKVEAGTGYFQTSWHGSEIKSGMGNIEVTKKDEGIAWGAVYWQYFEDLDKITPHETPLSIKKQLFVEKNRASGPVIEAIADNGSIHVGDKVMVRVELRVDRDMEYVHLKDMRAAALEPINVLSGYRYQGGLGYYETTGDAATNFFFSYLRKGTYVFEYPLVASQKGDFSNGITAIQCMYAPEFASHSEGIRLSVIP